MCCVQITQIGERIRNGLDEGIDVVVGYLTSYYRDGGVELSEQFGDQAPSLAGEIGEMLDVFLNSETPFGALYG